MIETALQYINNGWAVFPVHGIKRNRCTCGKPKCKSAGKHPIPNLTPHGFQDATRDPEKAQEWWDKRPFSNIAIATGRLSGNLLVVDIDVGEGKFGDETWADLIARNGGCPNTLEAVTGGGGKHIYFHYPSNTTIKSSQNALGENVDVKADGGYVLTPPSNHISGGEYFWDTLNDEVEIAQAPIWLVELCREEIKRLRRKSSKVDILLLDDQIQEMRSALNFINSENREVWLEVGMALHSTGAGDQAYGLWADWSSRSSKYDPRDQQKTWDNMIEEGGINIASIFFLAKKSGWTEPPLHVSIPIKEPDPPPMEIFQPPGILNIIKEYIMIGSPRPQYAFAVNAAIALCALILGRKIKGETKLRTNIYLISVGSTASGKDYPRTALKEILIKAGMEGLLGGENLASGQGLMTRMSLTHACLFQLDEFGLMMNSLKGFRSGRHDQEILRNFMTLYSSANQKITGTEYADQSTKKRTDIPFPCAIIHATTTPDSFYEALSSKDILSGFMNRFLVVEVTDKRPDFEYDKLRKGTDTKVPQEVLDWIKAARAMSEGMKGFSPANPIKIKKTPEALVEIKKWIKEIEIELDRNADNGMDSLWSRALEHSEKLCIIAACADDTDSPVIIPEHVQWAVSFVRYYIKQLSYTIQHRIADTTFERNSQMFFTAILGAGERGLTQREIDRKSPFTRFPMRERKSIMDSLKAARSILMANVKIGKGRPRQAWVAQEQNKEE